MYLGREGERKQGQKGGARRPILPHPLPIEPRLYLIWFRWGGVEFRPPSEKPLILLGDTAPRRPHVLAPEHRDKASTRGGVLGGRRGACREPKSEPKGPENLIILDLHGHKKICRYAFHLGSDFGANFETILRRAESSLILLRSAMRIALTFANPVNSWRPCAHWSGISSAISSHERKEFSKFHGFHVPLLLYGKP